MKSNLIVGTTSEGEYGESSRLSYEFLAETIGSLHAEHLYLSDIIYDISPSSLQALYDDQHISNEFVSDVFIRGIGLSVSEYALAAAYLSKFCALNNIRLINDYSHFYAHTKFAQALVFHELEVPYLRTIYAKDNKTMAEYAVKQLGYPFILKANTGSHGDDNYLVKNREEMDAILNANEVDFIAQEYCPNDRDYRLLIIGDDMLSFMRQGSDGSHLNNTSKGGSAEEVMNGEVSASITELAFKVAQHYKWSVAGVDVMPNKETGEMVFLEINSQPQLRSGALLGKKKELVRQLFNNVS